MQLYVIETACAQRPLLKASRNSNKLEKKLESMIERRSVQFTKNKVVEIGGGTFKPHNKANFNDQVQTHGLLILLNILLKFRIKNRLLPIAALS